MRPALPLFLDGPKTPPLPLPPEDAYPSFSPGRAFLFFSCAGNTPLDDSKPLYPTGKLVSLCFFFRSGSTYWHLFFFGVFTAGIGGSAYDSSHYETLVVRLILPFPDSAYGAPPPPFFGLRIEAGGFFPSKGHALQPIPPAEFFLLFIRSGFTFLPK